MMDLTEKEKLVFYGLVRWPHLNDTLLSEKINVGRSTVTTIRRRLAKRNLYTLVNVPDLEKIGCEIITALYGEFHPSESYESGQKFSKDLLSEFSNIFFMISMGIHRVSLGASATFTDIRRHIRGYHDSHHKIGLLSMKRHGYVLFPLKLSRVFRFFDYAPLLKSHFNLDVEDIDHTEEIHEGRVWSMSRNEKLVFYTMIKYPDLHDGEIADKVSMTRQTVNAVKKKIKSLKLMRQIIIPNIKKLGFELLVFAHIHINPRASISDREKAIKMLLNDASHIVKVSGDLESVLFSAFRDYTEYLNTYEKFFKFYRESNFLLEDPIIKVFSLREADMHVHHVYAPLVENILLSKGDEFIG